MKNWKTMLKPLVCTALLTSTLVTPTSYYATEGTTEDGATGNVAVPDTQAELNQAREAAKHSINVDSFGDLPTKQKYIERIEAATTVNDIQNILAKFNKEKQNAQRAEFEEKIEQAIHQARIIPGFLLVENHDVYIALLENAASEAELENTLAELREKAAAALGFNEKQQALHVKISQDYKYLGERIGEYNVLIEQTQTEAELEVLRQRAEAEHKAIVAQLIDEAAQRIQAKLAEISVLPELDGNNPDNKNQRFAWAEAMKQIPPTLSYVSESKKLDNQGMVSFYESNVLFWEIYANIEQNARQAEAYKKEFPNNAELAEKVRKLIFGDGSPYTTLDGPQEIPSNGNLRVFYNEDIVKVFNTIVQLYNQLKQAQESSESSSESSSSMDESASESSQQMPESKDESSSMAPQSSMQEEQSQSSSQESSESMSESVPRESNKDTQSSTSQESSRSDMQSQSSSEQSMSSSQSTQSSNVVEKQKQTTKKSQKRLIEAGETTTILSLVGVMALVSSAVLVIFRKNTSTR